MLLFDTVFCKRRKVRRGTATKILLNLCASLICVFTLFYATNWISGSKRGCRISNGLRIYFVLVSLMWNGAEAFNMYLQLVRVFHVDFSRLVQKLAFVAWGRLNSSGFAKFAFINNRNIYWWIGLSVLK